MAEAPRPLAPVDLHRLDQYLAGELSQAERQRVEESLATDPVWAAVLHRMRATAPATTNVVDAADVDAALEQVRRQATIMRGERSLHGVPNGMTGRGTSAARRLMIPTMLLGVCAAVAVVFGLTFRGGERATISQHRYQTAAGQRVTVPLADGSTMILAPATTAQAANNVVTLDGEAYFQVAPHPTHPVTVQTRNATVRVLGTRFVVRQYATDLRSRIVVEDGKVSVHATRAGASSPTPAILAAHMRGDVGDSSMTVTPDITIDPYTAWVNGRLVFDLMPLRDVIADVARAYGADIRLADSTLARTEVSTTISVTTQPLPDVLRALTQAVGAHVTRSGTAYVIAPGRSMPQTVRPVTLPRLESQYGR